MQVAQSFSMLLALLLASVACAQDKTSSPASVPSAVHGTLRGVQAAADRGPAALRRYIFMTRGIYNYRFEDFARAEWYEATASGVGSTTPLASNR